mmetsp:Transcript_5151/g.15065  ORF Transcript_5151/g.15065 Transcript_5151/m.15065 type:complete len:203 (-) Transcript_5151:1033-1641(-)
MAAVTTGGGLVVASVHALPARTLCPASADIWRCPLFAAHLSPRRQLRVLLGAVQLRSRDSSLDPALALLAAAALGRLSLHRSSVRGTQRLMVGGRSPELVERCVCLLRAAALPQAHLAVVEREEARAQVRRHSRSLGIQRAHSHGWLCALLQTVREVDERARELLEHHLRCQDSASPPGALERPPGPRGASAALVPRVRESL